MALNETTLASAIKGYLVSELGASNAAVIGNLNAIADAVAKGVVEHFLAHAQVTITGAAAAVMPGGGTAVVTGTGTVS